MIRGRVLGEVWATRKAPGLDGRKLTLVAVRRGTPQADEGFRDEVVVALDLLDARVGDEVTVAFGSGARNAIAPGPANRGILADAAVTCIVEGEV